MGDWYCSWDDAIRGPFCNDEMRALVEQGRLKPSDQVRRGKGGRWSAAVDIAPEFFIPPEELERRRRAAIDAQMRAEAEEQRRVVEAEQERARKAEAQQVARMAVGPRRWRYQMVQIPPNVSINEGASKQGVAASYLERVVEEYAKLGWEFHRVDEVGIQVNPGCLTALFGGQPTHTSYYVVTFRVHVEG